MVRTRASFEKVFVPAEQLHAEIVVGESAGESTAGEGIGGESSPGEGAGGESAGGESIAGESATFPAVSPPGHSKAQGALRRFIGGAFDDDDGFGGPGGWWVFVSVDVQVSGELVRPDLSGWQRARLPEPDAGPITVAPDWVCEVLSAASEAQDRVAKRRLYAAAGVAHYWIVDPNARTVEALTLEGGRWVDAGSFDEGAVARIAPFEELELPVARLFFPRQRAE